MKKSIFLSVIFLAVLIYLPSCGTISWKYRKAPPEIPEIINISSLGITQFQVTLLPNQYILQKAQNDEGFTLVTGEYPGVDKKVNIIVRAPDAASKYYLTTDRLSLLAQAIWVKYFNGSLSFDFTGVNQAWQKEKIANSDDKGMTIASKMKVVALPDKIGVFEQSRGIIINLGAKYMVEAILTGGVRVYAEVIKATALPSIEINPAVSLSPSQYALKIAVNYEWALYDGKSGRIIADSLTTNKKLIRQPVPRNNLYALAVNTANQLELERFMASPEYANFFTAVLQEEVLEYLSLFVEHYSALLEEAKQ